MALNYGQSQDELVPRTPQGFVENIHATSEFGEVYDALCDNWKEFCGQLRAFADNELHLAMQAVTSSPEERAHKAWYNFAIHQKDELNKDINFYEIELDDLINRDDVEVFLEQFKEIRQSVQRMYNGTTMSFRLSGTTERPVASSRIPRRPTTTSSREQLGRQLLLNNENIPQRQTRPPNQGRPSGIPAAKRLPQVASKSAQPRHVRRPASSEAVSSATVSRENLPAARSGISRLAKPTTLTGQPSVQRRNVQPIPVSRKRQMEPGVTRPMSQNKLVQGTVATRLPSRQIVTAAGQTDPRKAQQLSSQMRPSAMPVRQNVAPPRQHTMPVLQVPMQSATPSRTSAPHSRQAIMPDLQETKQSSAASRSGALQSRPTSQPAAPTQSRMPTALPSRQPTPSYPHVSSAAAAPYQQATASSPKVSSGAATRPSSRQATPSSPLVSSAALQTRPTQDRSSVPLSRMAKKPILTSSRPNLKQAPVRKMDYQTKLLFNEANKLEIAHKAWVEKEKKDSEIKAEKEAKELIRERNKKTLADERDKIREAESNKRIAETEKYIADLQAADGQLSKTPKLKMTPARKPISIRSPVKPDYQDDTLPETIDEEFDMVNEAKELDNKITDLADLLKIQLDELHEGPRDIPEAIDFINEALNTDDPVKLLTVLTLGVDMASQKASRKLFNAVKIGYESALERYEHLKEIDPLQHWIDMYKELITEVKQSNGILRDMYKNEDPKNFKVCQQKIAKLDEFSAIVVEKLEKKLSSRSPREMARLVFKAIQPLTEGQYCCNNIHDKDNPSLEVRILSYPKLIDQDTELKSKLQAIRKKVKSVAPELVSAEDTSKSVGAVGTSRTASSSRASSTKDSRRPKTPSPNPVASTDPALAMIKNQYIEAANDPNFSGTGDALNQSAREPRARTQKTSSSSNMVNAAKRYASKSPDRHHDSAAKSASPPKENRVALPGKELEDSIQKTRKEYEQLRDDSDLADMLQTLDNIPSSQSSKSRRLTKKGCKVTSAFDHLQDITYDGGERELPQTAPNKGESGYARFRLNELNQEIAQTVFNEPRTAVEILVPLTTIGAPDLFDAIAWENEFDDEESLALSFQIENMLEQPVLRESYVSGQKKLLQYDIDTVRDMKETVKEDPTRRFESAPDSEEELAISIAVAEALEESIRQDEIPMGANQKDSADVLTDLAVPSVENSQTTKALQKSLESQDHPDGPMLGGITTVLYARLSQRRFEHCNLLPGSMCPSTGFTDWFAAYQNLGHNETKQSKSNSSLFAKAWASVSEDKHFI